jgi:hypothetical protein
MMSNFTKGEWSFHTQSDAIWADHKVFVASMRSDLHERFDTPLEEVQPNVGLICAAPDLLAACDEMLWVWDNSRSIEMDSPTHENYARRDAAIIQLKKAIAKARGEG